MSYQPGTQVQRYSVESAVLSNERLYQQEGGEPIVFMVVDTTADPQGDAWLLGVYLSEQAAVEAAAQVNR